MEAGRELDALLAEKVLGWRWMKYPPPNYPDGDCLTGIFPPDEMAVYPVGNRYDRIWQPSNSQAPRFYDWGEATWWDLNTVPQRGLPHFSTDIAAAWQVMEKLRLGVMPGAEALV